ncbi:hypothetical protein J2Z83_001867 [Virgibacillus natechei]|uniref:Uncharacterized protein n=1 Tax=Virgibacillus natechei TaxID=1216297 RepID=A0ABS4IID9_9BACI|nr:hypothetical protein [Virgibacillus natechei]MBP1969759.1 hypothetical protein [Virgibacillus natechei]UZD12698.1 hypothetical protein OLD84_17670 [Virgibacillus natechei]
MIENAKDKLITWLGPKGFKALKVALITLFTTVLLAIVILIGAMVYLLIQDFLYDGGSNNFKENETVLKLEG